MKKRITLMTAVFALLAILALPNGMKGQTRDTQTINWVAADQGYTNGQAISQVDFDENVYAIFDKGTNNNNAPKYYTSGTAIRCYGGNTIEIHSSYTMIEINLGFGSSDGSNEITADDGEYANGTWTGSSTMVTFTIGGTSGNRRISSIAITYNMGGANPPRISANDVNIAYDATSGVIDYNIEYSVTGGVLTASSTADWIEFGDTDNVNYTVPFICSENPNAVTRTASVTLTYTYNIDQTVTKTIAVTQDGDPNATMTIAEVRAQGTGAVATKGIVTAISSNNNGTTAYIQDETAAVVVYGNFSAAVGDEIRAEGTLTTYKGLLEIGSPTVSVLSQNNTVDPTVMTIEAINADAAGSNAYQAMLVRIEDATVNAVGNNNTIAQGDNTITVYGSLGDAAVNDVVSFTGNIGCYTSVQIVNPTDITIQQSEEPAILVGSLTVNVPYTATEGTLNVTYENITEIMAEIMYCDEDGIEDSYDWFTAEIDDNNNVYYLVDDNDGEARTAYFKVFALDDNAQEVYSDIITINQAEYVAPALDYATLPFEFDGTASEIESTDGLTQNGVDNYNSAPHLKFDGTGDWLLLHFNETPGKLSFNIKGNGFSNGTFTVQTSEDGEEFTDLVSYIELTNNIYNEEFNTLGENVRYIKWIYTAKAIGNVALGNIVLEQPSNDPYIVVDPDMVNEDADEHDGTLSLTYANLEIGSMGDFDIQYYDAEGEEAENPDWIEATVAEQDPAIGEGYVVSYYMINNEGEARTAYFKVLAVGNDDFVYSNLVTISQEAYVAPVEETTFTLASSIESGRTYLITSEVFVDMVYAMGQQNTNNRPGVGTAVEDETITVTTADIYEVVISLEGTNDNNENVYSIYDAQNAGYLYAASSSSNHLKTKATLDDNGKWTIEFDDNGAAIIKAQGSNTRNWMRYNVGSNIFSCYASGQSDVYLYVKEETPETYTLTVDGYTPGSAGGYQLIASPVTVNPANVQGMTQGSYDLYAFDQAEEQEWRNWKASQFDLVPGKGYLYAKQGANQTFEFTLTGIPYNNAPIRLAKAESGDFPGWNLVGNPYGKTAYIDRDYYVMNTEGDDFIAGEGNAIEPMQGFFVIANTDGEELTLSTEAPANTGSKIIVNVNGNNGNVMDRAIVRVENGNRLPKLMLNPNNTKLYIPQDGDEFSVVRSQRSGRLPIVFKPAEDGDYSFSINTENVNMRYLHLIDHETGEDIDLLQNPEYRFTAKVGNKPNRFELEYKSGFKIFKELPSSVIKDEKFAYYGNGELVINGTGNLLVFDANGRLIKSETVNGDARIQVKAAPGLYMMQLITDDAVKTQKVVIK